MDRFSWGLIGYKPKAEKPHNIGLELVSQVNRSYKRLGLEKSPRFIMRRRGLLKADGVTPHSSKKLTDLRDFPDVVFVALPSTDNGEPAVSFIRHSLAYGATVITCEKGALANNFKSLKGLSGNFSRLGINATVGGGTRLMQKSQVDLYDPENIREIHMAVNGTLTYIFDAIGPLKGKAMTPAQAVKKAISLGYAEPGEADIKSVIRSEAEGDIPKKTAIFLNQSGLLNEYIDWEKLRFKLSDKVIAAAIKEARSRRFVVSIVPKNSPFETKKTILGGFDIKHENWRIIGGFHDCSNNKTIHDLAGLTDSGNGIVISLGPAGKSPGDGINFIAGPGAGPKPTVNAMLDDYIRLVRDKRS